MEVLVIDRESLTNQLIVSKLGAKGHHVVAEPNKNAAFDMVKTGTFDCVMVDPAPLAEARPVIIGVWKNIRTAVKPYLFLLSKTATAEEAILAGTNDVLNKPLSSQELEVKIGNAQRLMDICRMLATEDNVHSSGGMIGKAAFNQLFLSAIDRAFRYGERSLIVFIEVVNHDEVVKVSGTEAFEETIRKLTEKMTFMRRQSDVIGRLGAETFAILLQRPQYETEPVDAINRFSEVLDKFYQTLSDKQAAPRLHLRLIELPQGAQRADRTVPLADARAADSEEA
jgi:PleD family two-component response regulator